MLDKREVEKLLFRKRLCIKFLKNIKIWPIFLIITLSISLSSCTFNDNNSIDKNSIEREPINIEKENINIEEEIDFENRKELTWESEGVLYKEMFELVNDPSLPFVTYIPENDWTSEIKENGVIIQYEDYGKIDIVFMDESIDQKSAEQIFLNEINQDKLIKEEKSFPSWVKLYYSFNGYDEDKYVNIYAILGEYNNQYFFIYRYLDMEVAEIFAPIELTIYKEWIWKKTNESLEFHY